VPIFCPPLSTIVCRWHMWAVLWPAASVRAWWFPSWVQLPLPGELCWSWEAVNWNHLLAAGIQDQVPREFLSTSRKSWVCIDEQNLWLL